MRDKKIHFHCLKELESDVSPKHLYCRINKSSIGRTELSLFLGGNQNKNQNRSIDKIQNLGNRKEGNMQRPSPIFRPEDYFVYEISEEKKLIEICMETPCWCPSR